MVVQKKSVKKFTKRQIQGMALITRMEEARKSGKTIGIVLPDGTFQLTGPEAELVEQVLFKVRASRDRLDLEQVVLTIDAAIPDAGPDPWDELIGPFYTTKSLAILKGVTRQAMEKMRARDQILWVVTSDRKILYPSFQFNEHREPLPHLREVLRELGRTVPDGWTRALWLTGPVAAWGGDTAIDKLRRGTPADVSDVIAEAAAMSATRAPQ